MALSFFLRAISRLRITPPIPAPGRSGVAIVLIAKNEARHITEWAQFHHRAGVRHVFVYDNASTDGTAEVLRAALPADAVTVVPWAQKRFRTQRGREIHNQVLAYAHAAVNFGADFRWLAFIDVDEFLVPVTARSIPEALEGLDAHAHVSLPWQMFGRCGNTQPTDGAVLRNYLQRAADPFALRHGLNFKCLVDPARLTEIGVHGFGVDGKNEGVNDAGRPAAHKDRKNPDFASRERLQLNHYYTRSDAELQAKIKGGAISDVEAEKHARRVMRIVDAIEADTVEDRTVLAFLDRIGAANP
ncbi:glycosyltransferase family 92 protein [Pararhodobacter sp.]|uniref:glycosyltransferase family 92 protein n=1 Tax=Pararhodobacter sp. TaxID=2127056 RepID=UPI002AFED06D|nr:glycosyltransferase family 92 protein [Pararhodobacter sp.]